MGSTAFSIFHSSGPHSRLLAYPHFLPLQYVLHTPSSTNFKPLLLFSLFFFSHSNAILTSPDAISRTNTLVGVASWIRNAGPNFGSSWMAKCTWPRRCPKSVPTTRVPSWVRLVKTVRADFNLERLGFFLCSVVILACCDDI
ncbi:hypothetical protein V8G54_014745 [Vigna mungo]|uniref:Uncharacterized protein n=1 Tax=Vigna mungo TaxID=3915 RepID=A0AAQ3NH80_VIGMU